MNPKERYGNFSNLENMQESLVFEILQDVVEQEQNRGRTICACPSCLVDIAAVALNTLPPRYVADRYNIFGESDSDRARVREEAKKAILFAIHRVAARPHHF
jgi:competence protein ComFB